MSHLPKIDSTSVATWADSMVKRVRAAADRGFGLCHDGSTYDLPNFLADSGANLPWNAEQFDAVWSAMRAHPDFESTRQAFIAAHGVDFFDNCED